MISVDCIENLVVVDLHMKEQPFLCTVDSYLGREVD